MTVPLTHTPSAGEAAESALRHMMVVGGTFRDWADLGDDRWTALVQDLGAVVAAAGGAWLTLRAYEPGSDPVELSTWHCTVDRCEVIVDPSGDGRRRFAEAMGSLEPADEVNEVTVALALYEPADSEPDLVLILGPPTQLPPSLVWELAYAELVFVPATWDRLSREHVTEAIADFAGRRRRFGGLDT